MARIAGIDIPREKRVEVALTYIYGIGLPTAQKILVQTNVNADYTSHFSSISEKQFSVFSFRFSVRPQLRPTLLLKTKN